jgi:hypothetical protein
VVALGLVRAPAASRPSTRTGVRALYEAEVEDALVTLAWPTRELAEPAHELVRVDRAAADLPLEVHVVGPAGVAGRAHPAMRSPADTRWPLLATFAELWA